MSQGQVIEMRQMLAEKADGMVVKAWRVWIMFPDGSELMTLIRPFSDGILPKLAEKVRLGAAALTFAEGQRWTATLCKPWVPMKEANGY